MQRHQKERRRRVMLARKQKAGWSYQALADRTPYSKTTVYYALTGKDGHMLDIDVPTVLDAISDALSGDRSLSSPTSSTDTESDHD